jgi:MoaA/NifB/PqqE/SkfB family radical SAM enzyme
MAYGSDSFCPEAWSQLEINMAGDYSICCLANYDKDFGIAVDSNGNTMNVLTHSFEEALNSETHKQHRLQLSRNEKPTRCRNCYDSEDSTKGTPEWGFSQMVGRSKRQRVLRATSPAIKGYVKIYEAPFVTNAVTGETTSKIVNLHLRFGNLCNMKCVMCSPQHSNMWYDDWIALDYPQYEGKPLFKLGENRTFEIVKDHHGRNRLGFEQWWENPIWWERFRKVSPDLKYIYFTGGEPFLVPALEQCLDILIEGGYASEVRLRFDTNLTVIHTKMLEKLEKFKEVIMCVSIDDVAERYDYIRFPGTYSKFTTNLTRLKQTNIKVEYISSCIGIASIYAMPRVCAVANEFDVRSEFRFLEGPQWLDVRYLPQSAKLEIIEKYKNFDQDPRNTKWYKAMIKLLEKYIDESNTNYSKLDEFVRCMDILDAQRGTNWRVTLHDTYDLLVRHAPTIKNL